MSKVSGLTFSFVFLLILTLLAPTAWARVDNREATVYAIGTSRILGNDMSAGREAAIDAGLVAAVSRVLTDLLPPDTVAGNFQALNEMVLNRTDQFVRDYKVMTESSFADSYRLMVQATVSVTRLKDALKKAGIRMGEIRYPRVLICLAEKGGQDAAPRFWWNGRPGFSENVADAPLAQALADKGFVMVQPAQGAGRSDYPAQLSVAQAQALGRQMKADVVVVAMAAAQAAANTMQGAVRSYRATVTANAYRVSDGKQLTQVVDSAVKASGDAYMGSREALLSAAAQAGAALADRLDTAWFQQTGGGNRIEVTVTGVGGNIANFVKFRGGMSTMAGVDSIQLKEMMGDRAMLSVEYQGNSRTLADAMLLLSFDTFGINIEQVDPGAIQMQLVPR